jgi:hypothetical protein
MWALQFISRQRSWLLAAGALMNNRVGVEYHLEGDRRDDGWGDISINVEFAQYDEEDWGLVKSANSDGHGITLPHSLGRALRCASDIQTMLAKLMFKGEGEYDKENEVWIIPSPKTLSGKSIWPLGTAHNRQELRTEIWDYLVEAYDSICEAEDIIAGHELPSLTFKDAVDSYAVGVPGLVQGQRRWRGDD